MIKTKDYANKAYWEARYSNEDKFDWLQTFDLIKESLNELLYESLEIIGGNNKNELSILILGCGNSLLSEDLYSDGWENITNVDFSEVVITNMQNKHQDKELMKWVVADCRNMEEQIENETFDVVLDKATLDAISCGGITECLKTTNEVHRILKPNNSRYLLLSYSRFRLEDFLGEDNVDLDTRTGKDEKWSCDKCVDLLNPVDDDNGSVSSPSNLHYLYVLDKI